MTKWLTSGEAFKIYDPKLFPFQWLSKQPDLIFSVVLGFPHFAHLWDFQHRAHCTWPLWMVNKSIWAECRKCCHTQWIKKQGILTTRGVWETETGRTPRGGIYRTNRTESNLHFPLEQDCESRKTKCARLGENAAWSYSLWYHGPKSSNKMNQHWKWCTQHKNAPKPSNLHVKGRIKRNCARWRHSPSGHRSRCAGMGKRTGFYLLHPMWTEPAVHWLCIHNQPFTSSLTSNLLKSH